MQHSIRNNLMSHFYADTQINITVKPRQEDIDATVECIERCAT